MAKAIKKQVLGRGLSALLKDPENDIKSVSDKNADRVVGNIIELEIEVIEINPEKVSGTPVFAGTRVPIKNLFDYLEGGETLENFLEGFPPVTREQAVAVLEMAGKVGLN